MNRLINLSDVQQDRAAGVLIGAAVGDALGAGYEFESFNPSTLDPEMIGGGLGNFARGEWTDDTSMTWCVADVAARGLDLRSEEALTAIARNFRTWLEWGPPDIGGNTYHVLNNAGKNPTAARMSAEARETMGATNGSLMRTSPVALAYLGDPEGLVEAAMKVSALTHADIRAQEACAIWCLAIRLAVVEGDLDVWNGLQYLNEESRAWWIEKLESAEENDPSSFKRNGGAVVALQAAWSSIYHTPVPATMFPCMHFEDSLVTAIRVGHDTDTVASIAGALLGARWGMSAVPGEWRRILHGYPNKKTGMDLERLALLAARGGKDGLKYGWPSVSKIDYTTKQFEKGGSFAVHPHDDGVYIGSAPHLDKLPDDVDVVVSLCLTGTDQVPGHLEHVNFRLYDVPELESNPNLEYILVDAAETIQHLRDEGKVVFLHCVAAYSRTPTVAAVYSMQEGYDHNDAVQDVKKALPRCNPNFGFRLALRKLGRDYYS